MGSFKIKLVVYFLLLSLLPLAAAAWGFDAVAKRSETRRVDARLQAGLRASLIAYQDALDAAEREATTLARSTSFQKALAAHDSRALNRILPKSSNLWIRSGDLRAGVRPQGAARRSVTVLGPGGVLGEVVASVPLDARLVEGLTERSGLARNDLLLIVKRGVVVAGAPLGKELSATPGQTRTIKLDGARYRALVAEPLAEPKGVSFAVLAPQAEIDSATASLERRLALGLLGSLALIGLLAYVEGRSIVRTLRRLVAAASALARGHLGTRVEVHGKDEFAVLGRTFNEMAGQLQTRLDELEAERSRLREATQRLEETLSATHDVDQLLRVVVETAVESTGAIGGLLVGPTGDIVQAGNPEAGEARLELPLVAGRESFGLLVLNVRSFGSEARETAESLCAHAVIALENARLHRIVERQALVDALTGLANRRHAGDVLTAEISRAARFEGSLALVFSDLDDFKNVNDRYGHPFGDAVLREFAATLRESVREIDLAGRWGGEEFAVVLPGTDLAGGVRLAERVRASFAARRIGTPDGAGLVVTASFGVAAYPDARGEEELITAADGALYEAKRAGKNRVATAGSPTVVRGSD